MQSTIQLLVELPEEYAIRSLQAAERNPVSERTPSFMMKALGPTGSCIC